MDAEMSVKDLNKLGKEELTVKIQKLELTLTQLDG